MILRKIPFVNKKHYSPGGLPVAAAEGGQRVCSKIQNAGAEQEGGVNLLAQLWDCAADDLSHCDVTSEPVREISMAAKRCHQKSFSSDDCSKDLKESHQQTAGIK